MKKIREAAFCRRWCISSRVTERTGAESWREDLAWRCSGERKCPPQALGALKDGRILDHKGQELEEEVRGRTGWTVCRAWSHKKEFELHPGTNVETEKVLIRGVTWSDLHSARTCNTSHKALSTIPTKKFLGPNGFMVHMVTAAPWLMIYFPWEK